MRAAVAAAITVWVVTSAGVGAEPKQQLTDVALAKRLEALEVQTQAMQKELDDLKARLLIVPPPVGLPSPVVDLQPPLETVLTSAEILGRPAKLAIVEFTDFQCPFCGRFARETFEQIARAYVDSGQLMYVLRNFPLESLHPLAFRAAQAVECAAEQDRFWEMRAALFGPQQALAPQDLLRHAELIGLDSRRFGACLDGKTAVRVRQDIAEGLRLGVTSTPTFFIGEVQTDGRVRLFRKITGAQSFATFQKAISSPAAPQP